MVAILERTRFIGGSDEAEAPPAELQDGQPAEPLTLDPDPEPGRKTRRRSKSAVSRATAARQTRTAGRFTSAKAQKAAIADEINAYIKMGTLAWSLRDEPCAMAANEASKAIADSLADLIGRSDWLMDRFTQTTMLADCGKLAHAVWPVIRAMRDHGHFSFGRHEAGEEEMGDGVGIDAARYAPFRPAYS